MYKLNNLSIANEFLPKETYDQTFLNDVRDFFSERKSGHIGVWRYSEPLFANDPVNGMQLWAKFIKNAQEDGSYYIVNDEVNVIQKFSAILPEFLPSGLTLIDMGPGSKEAIVEKIGPFVKTGHVSSYVAVDIVKESVERAGKVVQENFSSTSFFGVAKDFYKENLKFPVSGTPVMLMFGQTLFNLPINPFDQKYPEIALSQRLAKFRMHLQYNGYLVIAQDINQNGAELYDAYAGENAFAENLLYRIQRDLPVSSSFDPEGFYFEPCWVKETGALAHTYICEKDMDFSIANEKFSLRAGQQLCLHNTYKFSSEYFLGLAKKASFDHIHTEMSDSGRVSLHLLKAV